MYYFHFLQPNQYVPGSKIFSEEERKIALPEFHSYQNSAKNGYPYLITGGKDLRDQGINFTDLTRMFASNDQVLYEDGCCHFNHLGSELIAKEMARVIKEKLDIKKVG